MNPQPKTYAPEPDRYAWSSKPCDKCGKLPREHYQFKWCDVELVRAFVANGGDLKNSEAI